MAGIINSFINKIAIGDYVLTYNPSLRIYHIGKIAGDYLFNSKINDCPHTRKVRWDKQEISRDSLSNDAKNSLGSTLTVFQLRKEQEKEILGLLNKKEQPQKDSVEIKEENTENSRMLIENVKENLKNAIQSLDPD